MSCTRAGLRTRPAARSRRCREGSASSRRRRPRRGTPATRKLGSERVASSHENSTSLDVRRARATPATAAATTSAGVMRSFARMWISLVAMNVWIRGRSAAADRLRRSVDVDRHPLGPGAAITGPRTFCGDRFHGLGLAVRRDRESGFDHVDAEPSELLGDLDLLFEVQRDAGRSARHRAASCRRYVHVRLRLHPRHHLPQASCRPPRSGARPARRRSASRTGVPALFSRTHSRANSPERMSSRISLHRSLDLFGRRSACRA